jgi:hypothetical protein
MGFYFHLLLILCFSPVLILGLHILIQRTAQWIGWKLPAQIGAFLSIIYAFIPVVYFEIQNVSEGMLLSPEDLFWLLIYIMIVYLMIGYLYLGFLNLGDTSLHIHILLEIAMSRNLLISSLENKYNKDKLIETKIDRLISLGLLRYEENKLYSGNKGYLYYSYLFDLWRQVMGMPTEFKGD